MKQYLMTDEEKAQLVEQILEDYYNESIDCDENNELFDNEMYVSDTEEEF